MTTITSILRKTVQMLKPIIVLIVLVIIPIGIGILIAYQLFLPLSKDNQSVNQPIPQTIQAVRTSYVEVYRDDLQKDLDENYPNTSSRNKQLILNTILEEAEKYNINPLILYAICHAESSFRPYIEHSQIIIEKDKKKIPIKAVGLMGIVWEWWSVQLIEAKITEVHSDLFDPVINIRAGAFIYNELYKQELHKVAKTKDESALLRYFGGSYPEYTQKINDKISSIVKPKLYRKD